MWFLAPSLMVHIKSEWEEWGNLCVTPPSISWLNWCHFSAPSSTCNCQYSLISPVQSGSNVALYVLHPVVGKMAD